MECLQYDRKLATLIRHTSFTVPQVQANDDVLIKVAYSGLCGTDLHIIQGEFPSAEKVIMGHEFTGQVMDVGSGVKKFVAGQKVGVDPNGSCGKCKFCYDQMPHFCEFGVGVTSMGINRDGGFAQYCIVPENRVHHLPPQLGYFEGALTEPVSCLLRGWDNIQPIKDDARILVCGAGIIGVLWCCLLHHRGFRDISVSEPSPSRRQIVDGLALQGVRAMSPAEVSEDTAVSYDVAIDCSGNARAMELSLDVLGKGGKLLLFGCAPQNAEARVKPFQIYRKELKIIGSLINPGTYQRSIQLVLDMIPTYFKDLTKLGVKTYKLDGYQSALDDLKAGSISKAIFEIETFQ